MGGDAGRLREHLERARRYAAAVLTALSLLLCVATGALWAASQWDGRTWWRTSLWRDGTVYRDRRVAINYWDGRLLLTRWEGQYIPSAGKGPLFVQDWTRAWGAPGWVRERPAHDAVFTDPTWDLAGLRHQRATLGVGTSRHVQNSLAIPLWMPAALFAALPAWAAWEYLRRRRALAGDRIRLGLCPRCGYDLRATPGRCPECGKAAEPYPA